MHLHNTRDVFISVYLADSEFTLCRDDPELRLEKRQSG
jgi:hypothetical protein